VVVYNLRAIATSVSSLVDDLLLFDQTWNLSLQ
jgi:hypothetical protein